MLARDKDYSLLDEFVIDEENEVLWTWPLASVVQLV